jgi:hypothetical protein
MADNDANIAGGWALSEENSGRILVAGLKLIMISTGERIDDEKMTRLRSILCRGQLLLPAELHLWRLQGEIRSRFM